MPRYIWCFTFVLYLLHFNPAEAQRMPAYRTVVIDAGHGGRDPGAVGRLSKEKNINLAIALKLGRLISASMKDVKVIYTRDKDFFVEVYRRAAIANESKADLFISIHCNANPNHALKGAETYVMGLHRSQANLNVSKLENAAILLEPDYQSSYDGFDPNSDESYIIFSLNQNLNLDKSTDFAAAIQAKMEERVGMNNRGVRQAGFLVLYKTTMPSVLVETGYISNAEEEKFLISEKGQDFIAMAIFKAFKGMAGDEASAEKAAPPAAGKETVATDKVSYRVQIATESRDIGVKAPKFSRFNDVSMYRHGNMYKYTVGDQSDLASALLLLGEVREKGVKDAFIVIFRNGSRIPQAEADRLMRK